MKVNKKPDLLTILAFIVCLGVVLSTWMLNAPKNMNGVEFSPLRNNDKKAAQLYRGNFIKVSSHITHLSH